MRHWLLGFALIATVGCAMSPTRLADDAPCTRPEDRFAALPLRAGVDGVAIYEIVPTASPNKHTASTLAPAGSPCRRATDLAACRTRIAGILGAIDTPDSPPLIRWEIGFNIMTPLVAIATEADDVRALPALEPVLGRIESNEAALAYFRYRNTTLSCTKTTMEAADRGYFFRTVVGCPEREAIWELTRDGQLNVVETHDMKSINLQLCATD